MSSMHSVTLQDPLEGCILSWPTRWPGLCKLEACPPEKFDNLRRIPGVRAIENKRVPTETGWYVPQSLRTMGKFPANLQDYEPEVNDKTPSGLLLRRYQARTVTFLRQVTPMREGVLLWADPGLGKCRHPRSHIFTLELGPVEMRQLPQGMEYAQAKANERLCRPAQPLHTLAWNAATNTLCVSPIQHIYTRTTDEPLFEIVGENGYTDHVLGEHKLLVINGMGNVAFRRADELQPGDWLALPRQVETTADQAWPEALVEFVAWWLADGGGHRYYGTQYQAPSITSHSDIPRAWRLATTLGLTPTLVDHGRTICLGKYGGRLLTHWGFLPRGDGEKEKKVSAQLFTAAKRTKQLFLQHLFSRDGTISEAGSIEYTCKGRHLSQQVSLLLLSFGVQHSISTGLKKATSDGELKPYHCIAFSSIDAVKFVCEIGFDPDVQALRRPGPFKTKGELAAEFIAKAAIVGTNINKDRLPINVYLSRLLDSTGVGFKKLGLRTDTWHCEAGHSAARVLHAAREIWPKYLTPEDASAALRFVSQLTDTFTFTQVVSVEQVANDTGYVMDVETGHGHSYLAGSAGWMVSHNTISSLHANWLDGYLQRPGLIVGPNIAKGVWCDEDSDALVHYGLRVLPLEGVKNFDPGILAHHTCFFCHYEILQAWQPWIFNTLAPAWMIMDESHFLINQKAQRAKAARQLALTASIERRFCLTGTAIPNTRLDLWNQMATCQPRQWDTTAHSFGVRHCAGQRLSPEDGGHWTFDGESNTEELRARLAGSFLRYNSDEVGDELPKMERHVIEAEGIAEHLLDDYSLAQRDVIKYLQLKETVPTEATTLTVGDVTIKLSKNDRKPGATRLVSLTTLIGILSEMKQAAAIKAVISILEQHNRLVVFTWRRKTAEYIYNKLADILAVGVRISGKSPVLYGPVHGDMKMAQRKVLAKQFAKDQCSIYIATMGAAGTSINTLSAASAALLVDLHWNTSQLRQAEKRVHRDGCTAEKVDIYYLVVRKTVDDMFIDTLQEKAKRAAAIAPQDQSELTLVNDLAPEHASGAMDFELFCARLMDDEGEEY